MSPNGHDGNEPFTTHYGVTCIMSLVCAGVIGITVVLKLAAKVQRNCNFTDLYNTRTCMCAYECSACAFREVMSTRSILF